MKIEAWAIGKTSEPYLDTGIGIFVKRLHHYLPFQWVEWPEPRQKSANAEQQCREEARLVLPKLQPDDYLVLLDERGQHPTSPELARWMERRLAAGQRRTVFLIGGPFGFAPELYDRAQYRLSLSHLTFSHQMVRVFLLEQLYRAMTILRNEPYHNP